ncbi:hypothetical protein ACSX1A_05050 [Pontibacter sp. MBLB2868]|uniref:hypothetical protein n=1 Tax=Pontibacter sp. MBLB2868 TaxID=3451555 RepID=UPI003F74D830
MPAGLLQKLELATVLDKPYVTIRYCSHTKFIWNEWRGVIPSSQLRDAMIFASKFALDNKVEYILADFTKLCAPSLEDQLWIAKQAGNLLKDSKLKKVANVMPTDFFQQIAIENIYEKASEIPQPCETRAFLFESDAVAWLFST